MSLIFRLFEFLRPSDLSTILMKNFKLLSIFPSLAFSCSRHTSFNFSLFNTNNYQTQVSFPQPKLPPFPYFNYLSNTSPSFLRDNITLQICKKKKKLLYAGKFIRLNSTWLTPKTEKVTEQQNVSITAFYVH